MPRPASVVPSVTSSLADAEQRLLAALVERPSLAERMSRGIAARRNLTVALLAGLLWPLLNALAARRGLDVDPFPFRWLQRVLIGSSLALAMIAARAYGDRQRRSERISDAQHDVAEAKRWASVSRTLQVMARTHTGRTTKTS